jgi:hypothetical protein
VALTRQKYVVWLFNPPITSVVSVVALSSVCPGGKFDFVDTCTL